MVSEKMEVSEINKKSFTFAVLALALLSSIVFCNLSCSSLFPFSITMSSSQNGSPHCKTSKQNLIKNKQTLGNSEKIIRDHFPVTSVPSVIELDLGDEFLCYQSLSYVHRRKALLYILTNMLYIIIKSKVMSIRYMI